MLLSDPAEGVRTAPLCVAARGFSLHAATTVAAHDREGLERLCRYANRPPLAYGRLQQLDPERISFAQQQSGGPRGAGAAPGLGPATGARLRPRYGLHLAQPR